MRTLAFGAALTLAVISLATAQQSRNVWTRTYDGPDSGHDFGTGVAVDAAGNVYAIGYSQGDGTDFDFVTIKYDARGHQLWSRRYDGPGHSSDLGYLIALDGSGNVVVAGDSIGDGTDFDLAVIKYDANGNEIFTRRFDGPDHGWDGTESGHCLAIDHTGNIIVACTSWSNASNYDDIILKYAPDGTLLWQRRHNGPANDYDEVFGGVVVDAADNIYVAGDTYDGADSDLVLLKYDSQGNFLWVRQWDSGKGSEDLCYSVALDPDQNVLMAAMASYPEEDYATLKYSPAGTLLWARTYDGPDHSWDVPFSVAADAAGNVCVTGQSGNHYDSDCATVSYDKNGNLRWAQRFSNNGPYFGDDAGGRVVFDQHGVAYVSGYSWGGWETGYDGFVLTYGADGTLQSQYMLDDPGHADDVLSDVAVDGKGFVYATGIMMNGTSLVDIATVKLATHAQSPGSNHTPRP